MSLRRQVIPIPRPLLCAWLALIVAVGAAEPASAAWPTFGGTNGRSGHAVFEGGKPPLSAAWSATAAGDQGVWTSPIVTQGRRPLVAYGTQKPYWMSGPTSSGHVHLRDLVTGAAVGPELGVNVDDGGGDADTFGSDNKASAPFVDSSAPGDAPGQLFVVHNDDGSGGRDSDVAIAQIDLATGVLVRDVPVPDTPHFAPGGATRSGQNGSDVSGSPALSLDAAGDGVLVFRVGLPVYDAGGSVVRKIEKVHVVPIRNGRSPAAVIDTAAQRVTPDFQATSRTSPTLVTLTDPVSGQPTRYVAMGTSEPGTSHYVKTYRLSDLAPGPVSDPLRGWGQTVATPFGAPDDVAPYLLMATSDGSTGRVYKLVQQGSRLAVATSVTFNGSPSPALSTTALRGTPSAGHVVVTADKNLYVLRASDLGSVGKLSSTSLKKGCAPCKSPAVPPPSEQTGFLVSTATVAGGVAYVARDDGSQLAVDVAAVKPLPAGQFTQAAGNAGSSFTRGAPAVSSGHVVFAGVKGVFAYRLGSAPPPPPPPGGGTTFRAVADANVKSTSAAKNYGTATTLRARFGGTSSDTYRTYLRFDVAGVMAPITGARLRLWVTDAGPDGGRVHSVASTWGETALTWDNAPALGAQVGAAGATSAVGSWTEIPLGTAVPGDGVYAFALDTASSNSAIYDSREGAHPPELVLSTG